MTLQNGYPSWAVLDGDDSSGGGVVKDGTVVVDDEYRCPKVAWCVFSSFVEAAVCYQVRESSSDDWDVGVTLLRWSSAQPDFTDAPSTYDYVLTDNDDYADFTPDLAYDVTTGNIFIAWTRNIVVDPPIDYPCRGHIVRLAPYVQNDLISNKTFSEMKYAFESGEDFSSFVPRMDIGPLDDLGYYDPVIAVAFTGKNMPGMPPGNPWDQPFWPGITFIDAADDGFDEENEPVDSETWGLHNNFQDFEENDSGLPYVDIAPISEDDNGIVVFVMMDDEDRYRVYEWDLYHINHPPIPVFDPEEEPYEWLGTSPSVSIHFQGGSPVHYASICFFKEIESDQWRPFSCRVLLETSEFENFNPTYLNLSWPYDSIGEWEGIEAFLTRPGMAGAITTSANNKFWAGWANNMLFQETISSDDKIFVSYGDTNE